MVGEMVVLFEGGPCMGKKSVVSFTFALSFCSSFLLFGLFGWFFLLSEDTHVVECWCSECWGEDVQVRAMSGMYWGLE